MADLERWLETGMVQSRAEGILVLHARQDVRRCLCGWAELGQSHARHQVEELRKAGLLKEESGSVGS